MVRAEYTAEPRDISAFPLRGGLTDVTLRENITQEERTLDDGTAQTVWVCDEISCRYNGRVSESQIGSNYAYWRAIFSKDDQTVLGKAKNAKIAELSDTCRAAITSGVTWNGGHYSLTVEDQLNISALRPGDFWHADGEAQTKFTAEMIEGLQSAVHDHVQNCLEEFNRTKTVVLMLNDINDIQAVRWG